MNHLYLVMKFIACVLWYCALGALNVKVSQLNTFKSLSVYGLNKAVEQLLVKLFVLLLLKMRTESCRIIFIYSRLIIKCRPR